jgi:hypothetical protein
VSQETLRGEFFVPNNVTYQADLHFGNGHVGEAKALQNDTEKHEFATRLQTAKQPLTIDNTAWCVEDREWTALANGVNDPVILRSIVVRQKPGGLDLWAAKAAAGANLAAFRDAKDFTDLHAKVLNVLELLGYEPAAHDDCGADKSVEKSTADEVDTMAMIEVLPALGQSGDTTLNLLNKNRSTKRRLLEDGFYGSWSPSAHQTMVAERYPHNFAYIRIDSDDKVTHGHDASGLVVVTEPGYGYAKNQFIADYGQSAFGLTTADDDKMANAIVQALGGSAEERARFRLEMAVDPPQVLNQLVVRDFPAFADAA